MDYNDLERLSVAVAMALMQRMGTDSITFTERELENVQKKGIADVQDMNCLLFDNKTEPGKVTLRVMPLKEAEAYEAKKIADGAMEQNQTEGEKKPK